MRNIYKYNKLYSEAEPIFLEEDIFKTIIPLVQNLSEQATMQATIQATMQATIQATMQAEKLLDFCITPRTRIEMQDFMNLKNRDHFSNKILKPLVEKGLLLLVEPDKPTSPNQMYYSAKPK
jgi:ATP-dependent DNA helicase RecG